MNDDDSNSVANMRQKNAKFLKVASSLLIPCCLYFDSTLHMPLTKNNQDSLGCGILGIVVESAHMTMG